MSDSIEKCLIDLIDVLNDSLTHPDGDQFAMESHTHYILSAEDEDAADKIKARLKKLGESNDIHSKIRENPENR